MTSSDVSSLSWFVMIAVLEFGFAINGQNTLIKKHAELRLTCFRSTIE